MPTKIIAASVEKVQTFMFDILQSHEQEKQAEAHTLRTITGLSHEISACFKERVIEALPDNLHYEELPAGSGCVMLAADIKDCAEAEIISGLDGLATELYHTFKGKMRISYGIFPYDENNVGDSIQKVKGKDGLRDPALNSLMISRLNNVFFRFPDAFPDEQPSASDQKTFEYYADTLNELRPEVIKPDERFRIAFIKADLDGMGEAFKSISDFDQYKCVSDVLNKYICLDGIHGLIEVALTSKAARDGFKMFPLYAAGDDIFFAVHVFNFVKAIHLLRVLLDKINSETNERKTDGRESPEPFTLRIGVDISFNTHPIRYYFERAEEQMSLCKRDYSEVADRNLQSALRRCPVKISMNNTVFYDPQIHHITEDNKKNKECERAITKQSREYLIWNHSLNLIKLIKKIKHPKNSNEPLFEVNSFLYNLLAKCEDEIIAGDKINCAMPFAII